MRRILWIFAIGLTASSSAAARDIYVSNTAGQDGMNGDRPEATTSIDGPVRTIAKALRLAIRSDHIVLVNTGVPYRECVTLQAERNSGLFGLPFVLEGNGAILDGSVPVPDEAWEFVSGNVFRFQPPRLAYQQLFIDDKPVRRKQPASDAAVVSELGALEWCLADGYLYFCTEKGKIPQQYALTHAGMQTGITLFHTHDVVVNDLIVQGFQLDGINAHDCQAVKLLSITCRGNGRSGVCVSGAARGELAGAALGDNGAGQLWLEPFTRTHVYNSLLNGNTAPDVIRHGGQLFIDGQPVPQKN